LTTGVPYERAFEGELSIQDVKDNMVVAVGWTRNKAIIVIRKTSFNKRT